VSKESRCDAVIGGAARGEPAALPVAGRADLLRGSERHAAGRESA